MEFKINGGSIKGGPLTPAMKKVRDFLEKSEDGELWDNYNMAVVIGCSIGTLQNGRTSHLLSDNCVLAKLSINGASRNKVLWGSVATIRAYHEQEKADDDS